MIIFRIMDELDLANNAEIPETSSVDLLWSYYGGERRNEYVFNNLKVLHASRNKTDQPKNSSVKNCLT